MNLFFLASISLTPPRNLPFLEACQLTPPPPSQHKYHKSLFFFLAVPVTLSHFSQKRLSCPALTLSAARYDVLSGTGTVSSVPACASLFTPHLAAKFVCLEGCVAREMFLLALECILVVHTMVREAH